MLFQSIHIYYESHNITTIIFRVFLSLITPIFFGCAWLSFLCLSRSWLRKNWIPLDLLLIFYPLTWFPYGYALFNVVITCINTLYFLCQYCALLSWQFFHSNTLIFIVKFYSWCIIYWIRGAVPRYRYDQLMTLQWRKYLHYLCPCYCIYGDFHLVFC